MKILYSWLRELTGTRLDPATLAERLTMSGTQVESVERTGPAYARMVVGRVLEAKPAGGRLRLCRVAVGDDAVELVSAAANARPALAVAVALPGARLADGTEIGERDFDGLRSQGMLLSLMELGLSSHEEGILELAEEAEPGVPLAEALGLDDHLLEAEITPNRGDCLSMVGVAREVVALGEGELRFPPCEPPEEGPPVDRLARIEIRTPEHCYRYVGRVVEELSVASSPLWLAARLFFLGVRPLNNVVDITNYVLFELGQPLHPFDLDRVPGGEVIVRLAPGEGIVTLDGAERVLPAGALAICDREKPIAVAGVMGGQGTEVRGGTRRLLIESAHFAPISIRRTAKELGLPTEASYRFERGIDQEGVPRAAARAAYLLSRIAGGRVATGAVDCCPGSQERRKLSLRAHRANALLGSEIPAGEMREILGRLGMGVSDGDPLEVRVPSHRNDILEETDLVEEVARIHGYDRVPSCSRIPHTVKRHLTTRERLIESSRPYFASCGFFEALTPSLLEEKTARRWLAVVGRGDEDPHRVSNPVSESMSTLRPSLVPGLLQSLAVNLNRRRPEPRLFEVGVTFRPAPGEERPRERWCLAGALAGSGQAPAWDRPARRADFYDLRGLLEGLGEYLGLPPFTVRRSPGPLFRGALGAELLWGEESLGLFGELGMDFRQSWGLRQEALFFELDLECIGPALDREEKRYRGIPRYPAVERDLAVVVDGAIPQTQVENLLREEGGELVEGVRLFDCYRGEPLPPGKKSLAYSLVIRSPDRTLTDEEADELRRRIGERLVRELGGSLRE